MAMAVVAAVAAMSLAACGGGRGPGEAAAASTTTQRPTTTTTVVKVQRDTEIAVRKCVELNRGIGIMLGAGVTDQADDAQTACREAVVLLAVDDDPSAGRTIPHQISAAIEGRISDTGLATAIAVLSPGANVLADSLESGYQEWAAQIDALLAQGS